VYVKQYPPSHGVFARQICISDPAANGTLQGAQLAPRESSTSSYFQRVSYSPITLIKGP